MISSLEVKSFLTQKVKIKKKFFKDEIFLYHFFKNITKIYPDNVIFISPYIFFFVKSEDYFKAKRLLKTIRTKLLNKKVMIIKSESTLIRLLFSLFPDTYIHDVIVNRINEKNTRTITIIFYFYEDRGIAIGRSGNYIKIINRIFEEYILLENSNGSLEIKCDIINPKGGKM